MSAAELEALRERAKELRCLYRVGEALSRRSDPPHQVFTRVLEAIPEGWQYPEKTSARITYFGRSYALPSFAESPWQLRAPLRLWQTEVGAVEVVYGAAASFDADPFLPEERQLLQTIAARAGEYLEWKHQELVGERIGAAEEHWRWRQRFAERLAQRLEPARWGVERVYLSGSTEEGTAGPGSDIDLIVVFHGSDDQRRQLQQWLEGWSLCLAEVAREHTGYAPQSERGLLDVRFVDEVPTSQGGTVPLRELRLAR